MNIINLSDLTKDWNWLRDEFVGQDRGQGQAWFHYSSVGMEQPKIIPKKDSVARVVAAWQAVSHAKNGSSVLVSHGPRPAMYSGTMAKFLCPDLPHLMYSFNFTNLPGNTQRKMMESAFKQVTKFVCYSTLERTLYAECFDIPIEKIDMMHWSVHPPKVDFTEAQVESGDYICALGSQGRDYETLFAAMKLMPNIRLVIVATPDSIHGLDLPGNVTVHTNIPYTKATNILMHSRFMVVPLRDSEVPCGHVTIVAAMFLKKAIVSTNSKGVHDYIKNEETGVFYSPRDTQELVRKITELWEDQVKTNQLSENALSFAEAHCTEKKVVAYFEDFLKRYAK